MNFSEYTNIEEDFFKKGNPMKKLLSVALHLFEAQQTGILYGTNETKAKFLPTDIWDRGVMEAFDGKGMKGAVLKYFGTRIVTARKLSPIFFYKEGPYGEKVDSEGLNSYVLRTCADYYKKGVSVLFCPDTETIPDNITTEYLGIPFYIYNGKIISMPDKTIKVNTRIIKQFSAKNFISIYLPNYGILVLNTAKTSLFQREGEGFTREAELKKRFDLLIKFVEIASLALLGKLKDARGGEMLKRKEKHLRETSKRLAANEKRYRDLYENAPIAYFSMDPGGNIFRVNRQTGVLFGYADNRFTGKNIFTLFAGKQNLDSKLAPILTQLKAGLSVKDMEIKTLKHTGETIWISLSIDPIIGKRNQIIELRAMAMDITQRHEKEKEQSARREAEAAARSRREFLDNSGEGFLSFNRDLIIDREYSRECEKIFNTDLAGQSIAIILHPGDPHGQKMAVQNFNRILSEDDPHIRKLYLSLMPQEYQLGEKYVKIAYKYIDSQKMMMILTDITQHKQMENEIRDERNRLKFVVSAVIEFRDFFELLEEFDAFYKKSQAVGNFQAEHYRHIHTFKGLFAQQNFIYMPKALHKAEDSISIQAQANDHSDQDLKTLLEKFGCMCALEKDLDIIRTILGRSFLEQKGQVKISKDMVLMMGEKANHLLKQTPIQEHGDELKTLLQAVLKLGYIDLKELIYPHIKGVAALAGRLGKPLKPIHIQGDDIQVPPDLFSPFTRTLVHVFRNAVDHGIEALEDREACQKDESALITCAIKDSEDKIIISIGDDGRGINFSALKKEAVARGILTEQQVSGINSSEAFDLLFLDGLSTEGRATELSGRGIGLAAVKTELNKLDGEIKIKTIPGKGTTFYFTIPFFNTNYAYRL